MNTFGNTKSKINPRNILGSMGLFDDADFERETSVASTIETGKFPSTGSIEFKKKQAEINRKKDFYQTIEKDRDRAKRERDRLFEEEINDIVQNLPTEQKNKLLHYQASYKDRSIYQRAELRKKLIEEQKKADKQQKTASIPSPTKQPSAMEGAFEGGSGSQGSGTANLSAQAVG